MTRLETSRNKLFIVGAVLFIMSMFTGCTLTKRYHFNGFSMGRVLNGGPIQHRKTAKTKSDQSRCSDRVLKSSTDQMRNVMVDVSQKEGSSNSIGTEDFVSQGVVMMEGGTSEGKKIGGQNLSNNSRSVNVAPRVGYLNVAKPAGVTYFDAADPESWAIVFYCLFIFLGVMVLISNLIWLKVAAIASLLLAIICTVLCDGEFYYSFTKVMAGITSAVLVFLGIREDLF